MIIYILLTVIATALHTSIPLQPPSPNPNSLINTPSLQEVQKQIDQLIKKDQSLKLKINRLAEIVFENEDEEMRIQQVDMVPSIGIPYKDNFYYSMMFKKRDNFYTLKADLIYSNKKNATIVVSARNQYTYFVQNDNHRLLHFYRCKLYNKKTVIQLQLSLEISHKNSIKVDSVFISQHSNNRNFILVDRAGLISVVDRQNNTLQQIITKHPIVQTQKLNHNLVVLTKEQLFFLNVNKNYTKISCLVPYGSIDSFKFEDSNFRYIYGIKQGIMYQFQLSNHCKITKIYYIPLNSTIQIASQLAFILARSKHYVLNLTSGDLKPYRMLVDECAGQQKISIIRKIQSNYVLSRICLHNHKIQINMMSIDLHEQQPNTADFSKFRIPLLLLSFGVIVYMTVRSKRKERVEEQSEQQIRMRLFQQYPQLREAAIKEQAARLRSTLKETTTQKESKTVQIITGSKVKIS